MRGKWPTLVLALLIVLAVALPRLLVLSGIHVAAVFEFADMADHLYFLDNLAKRHSLPGVDDPFLTMFPETTPDRLAEQWTTGVHHVARLWALRLGTGSLWTTLLTNLLFTAVLVLAVVGLGRSLGSLRVGLWAALLTVLCPALVASTWYFSLDYPLVGMALMGLLLLWKTRGFSLWRWTLAFAVWSALGTVVKPTYAIYVLGPAAWALVHGLRQARPRWLVPLRVVAGLAVSLLLVYAIYRPDWDQIYRETRVHFVDRTLPGASIDPFTWEWLLANIKMAAVNYPLPLLLLALPGLALLHTSWKRQDPTVKVDRWFWIAFLWSTYLFLTLLANKMERYIQPVYPVFCLLTAYWVVDRVGRRWQTALLSLLAAAFAATLVVSHYHPTPWFPQEQDTIAQSSSLHPFRYEFHMPGKQRLARLRRLGLDSECQLTPMVDQLKAWLATQQRRRPLGLIYLRDPARMRKVHPPVFFRRLIPAVTLALPKRIFVVPNLHELPHIPMYLRHAPTLVVIHGPEINAAQLNPPGVEPRLKVAARRMLDVTCLGERFAIGMTLAHAAAAGSGPR